MKTLATTSFGDFPVQLTGRFSRVAECYIFDCAQERRIYLMQRASYLKAVYTDDDYRRTEEFNQLTPIAHGEDIEYNGALYRVHVNGDYSDLGYLVPIE